MEKPKIRFSLTMPLEVSNHLAQLMEWLNTTNATSVICQAITSEYCRVANIKAIENMKADISAKRELPAEGRKDEPAN